MPRARRSATTLTIAIVVVLLSGTGVAVDRLRPPPDPFAVEQIRPEYSFVAEPAHAVAASTAAGTRGGAAAAGSRPKGSVQRQNAARVSCPALPRMPSAPSTGGRATVAKIPVYDKPYGRVVRTLTNPTHEGQPLYTLVHAQQGLYLRVQLVARPNGSTAWVRATDFARYPIAHRIVVQRCAKKLTVFRSGRPIWSRTVAVGKPSTPTPLGNFFVDFVTRMKCCAYGPIMMSVAGFSNVLFQFGKGGTGQIAIHGTNADWSVGKAASNGCVRMHNADIVTLSRMVPSGTPVTIVD